jgi:hypothetical protein
MEKVEAYLINAQQREALINMLDGLNVSKSRIVANFLDNLKLFSVIHEEDVNLHVSEMERQIEHMNNEITAFREEGHITQIKLQQEEK